MKSWRNTHLCIKACLIALITTCPADLQPPTNINSNIFYNSSNNHLPVLHNNKMSIRIIESEIATLNRIQTNNIKEKEIIYQISTNINRINIILKMAIHRLINIIRSSTNTYLTKVILMFKKIKFIFQTEVISDNNNNLLGYLIQRRYLKM